MSHGQNFVISAPGTHVLTHGVYAMNKLARQLPCSHVVRVYTVLMAGHPGIALRAMHAAIVDGPAKRGAAIMISPLVD